MASAEVPARTLFGVTRVVITCDADSSLTGAEAAAVCAQLVKKAQGVTSLPVVALARADVAPSDPQQGEQLVLHVALSTDLAKSDRGTLSMTVTPSRNELGFNKGTPIKSEAQLARIQNGLVVQGPVQAFAEILRSAPAKLRRPIRLES